MTAKKPRAPSRHRSFGPPDRAVITETSVFVLTAVGAEVARQLQGETVAVQTLPFYDRDVRELWFEKLLVKALRHRAPDQEILLSAFEEEQWARHIDSPLSPHDFQEDPKHRLRQAVYKLNQHQAHRLIRFFTDGTGEGACWERLS